MRMLSETVSESCQRGVHVKTVLIEHWSIELRYCCCFTGLEWVKTHLCVKMSVFASILKHSNSGLKWRQTAEKEYMCNSILHLVI